MGCMRFLVTGGAGFIGCNIARRLVKEGHEVAVLDDMSIGREGNLKGLPASRVRVVKGDVRNTGIVKELTKGVDGVFHEAARSSALQVQAQPLPACYPCTDLPVVMKA